MQHSRVFAIAEAAQAGWVKTSERHLCWRLLLLWQAPISACVPELWAWWAGSQSTASQR